MSNLLVFYPQGKYLYIEFLGGKYIENQPKNPVEVAEFAYKIKPIIAQLDAYVEKHGLKEIVEVNLGGVPIAKLNSEMALHLMSVVCEIRPDKGILEKIKITNVNPMFNIIYKGVRSRLPARVKDIIEVESNSKFF
jgi:hypothetical protein